MGSILTVLWQVAILLSNLCIAATVSLPSYPLAVKSPYLSAWVPGNQINDAASASPQFWNGINLTWPLLARVDGKTYSLFGNPQAVGDTVPASTMSVSYTASHTYIQLQAGLSDFSLDFFSPVLPGKHEYASHSLPYSYLTINVTTQGTDPVDIQILSGVDQTWTAQKGSSAINYAIYGSASFFQFQNPDELPFTEVNDMATYGSFLFAITTSSMTSWSCGSIANILDDFTAGGTLDSPRSCSGNDLVAFSADLTLGGPNEDSTGVTFVVGFDRDKVINYLGSPQTGYHRTKWPTIPEGVDQALQNYDAVLSQSLSFDAEICSRAEAVSNRFGCQYADIVEASVRQVFGGMELTIPSSDSTDPPSAFLKEISSDGNVNTIDFIFQSWPIFVSLNPEYIKILLEPVLDYLRTGRYPNQYVIHDIGARYPNVTGHDDGKDEPMPLFETSALFILLYAYQELTGDDAFAQQYQRLLQGYADYMATRSLYPDSQLISVDTIHATANQTGLAIQCAIGLSAAGILLNNSTYADIAKTNAEEIYDNALGLDGTTPHNSMHFTYNYGKSSTWNVLFPAFSDILLNLNTFPKEAWDLQSSWYEQQIQPGGLPFAGPSNYTNYTGDPIIWGLTDWNIVAAAVSSDDVQAAIIRTTHDFMTNGLNHIPFGTKYNVEGPNTGLWIGRQNRATVGSHFALLALEQGSWYSSYLDS